MDDETKERIVRAILLFSAIVIAAVAAYTTFILFSTHKIDTSLSPPENTAKFSPPESQSQPKESFDIERDETDQEGKTTTYKDEEINPYDENNLIMKSPLVISEDLGKASKKVIAILMIAIELIVVFFIYRRLDRRLVRKK